MTRLHLAHGPTVSLRSWASDLGPYTSNPGKDLKRILILEGLKGCRKIDPVAPRLRSILPPIVTIPPLPGKYLQPYNGTLYGNFCSNP